MKKSDRELGMGRDITRRDFIHDAGPVAMGPGLPKAQKIAQKYQVKRPLLLTNVLIRSSKAMDKLGIAGARCPGRMHGSVFMFKGINTGGYRHEIASRPHGNITMANSDAGADAYTHVAIDQAFRAVHQ